MSDKVTILETDRLLLRRYCKEDLQDLYEYLSDEAVVKYEPYDPMSIKEAEDNLAWRIICLFSFEPYIFGRRRGLMKRQVAVCKAI